MGIIIKPLVTEKMTAITEKLNRFGFIVRPEANKLEIKSEIEALYNGTFLPLIKSKFDLLYHLMGTRHVIPSSVCWYFYFKSSSCYIYKEGSSCLHGSYVYVWNSDFLPDGI